MNSEEEAFHDMFATRGGIYYSIDPLFFQVKKYCNDFLKKISSPNGHPKCNFNIIDNSLCAASAKIDKNGNYYIGLNFGAYMCIINFFDLILSHPNVLTNYGDPTIENAREKVKDAQIFDCKDIFKGDFVVLRAIPNDPVRRQLSMFFSQVALRFLIVHEYTHVLNGHLKYLQADDGAFSELTSLTRDKTLNANLGLSTFEMDSDAMSICSMVDDMLYTLDNPLLINPIMRGLTNSFENGLYLTLFPIYCLFKFFNRTEWSLKHSHPPFALRAIWANGTAMQLLELYFPNKDPKIIDDICGEVFIEAERAFASVSNTPVNVENIMTAVSPIAEEYQKIISDAWDLIHPKLSKYSHVPLMPVGAGK